MVSSSTRTHDLNLSLEAIQAKALAFAREIRTFDPDLQIIYAVHRQGQLQNTLRIMEDRFLEHPAGKIASSIAGRGFPEHEPSAFHGLCAKRTSPLMGLNATTAYLAIISINIDEFQDFSELLLELYRQTWLGLELTAFFRNHPNEKIPDRPLNLKRNLLGETRVNLRTDLFTVLMAQNEGYTGALADTIRKRALETISARYGIHPERYPFPLIAQTTAYAISDILPHLSTQKSRLHRCSELVSVLSGSVTDSELKLWNKFAGICQDMAWRGYPAATILGCAVHTSDDAFLRAVAHKVSEFADIVPQNLDQISTFFNGFIGIQNNYSIHVSLIEQIFETALDSSLEQGVPDPFFKIAKLQNDHLCQGRFIGWCASALQSAGRVYREANAVGIAASEAARIEFESQCYLLPLTKIHKFGEMIVKYLQNGETLTFENMIEIARDQGDVEQIAQSFEYIIHQDRISGIVAIPHSAEKDILLEGIDPEKLQQKISQFTQFSTNSAHKSKLENDKKNSTELALEDE